jgi:hypothetical protein
MVAPQSKAMKTCALILIVCLVIASPAHAQMCRVHFSATDPVCDVGPAATPGTFLHKICNLQLPYDPEDLSPTYSSPTCINGSAVAPSFLTQLEAAFTLASDDVQRKLCALDQVFITPSASFSTATGIWEIDPLPGGPAAKRGKGGTYITIPDAMLTKATSLAAAEMALYADLFGISSYPSAPSQLPLFSSTGTVANRPGAGALAILAHELGHIVLADTNADGWGGEGETPGRPPSQHPRSALCRQPSNSCFENAFLEPNNALRRWNPKKFHDGMRRWIKFGDQKGNKHQKNTIDFDKISKAVKRADYAGASGGMKEIYTSDEFVSLFAAVSPEEDFVETYKYKVLAAARDPITLEQLNLTIAFAAPLGGPVNVLPFRVPRDLAAKIRCVSALVP